MYKISWSRKSDRFHRTFVLVPDVYALFEIYHALKGYGTQDGVSPIEIEVTNLDGYPVDMSKGLAEAASYGTYSSKGNT